MSEQRFLMCLFPVGLIFGGCIVWACIATDARKGSLDLLVYKLKSCEVIK